MSNKSLKLVSYVSGLLGRELADHEINRLTDALATEHVPLYSGHDIITDMEAFVMACKNQKIPAIKALRAAGSKVIWGGHMGLKEAKDCVEFIAERL